MYHQYLSIMKKMISLTLLLLAFAGALSAQKINVTRHAFQGKFLKSKITVSIWLEETEDGDLSGEIVYTSSKHKTPFRVFGYSNEIDNKHIFSLFEYQADGSHSGYFNIVKDLGTGTLSGQWNDMGFGDKQRTYDMQLTKAPFPTGKGGTFTYSSSPAGEYSYSYPHQFKGEQGGHVTINNLKGSFKKKDIHISKYDPQLAEFQGNLMLNDGCLNGEMSECGYTFCVQVFKDFVRVKTTSDMEKYYDCFGAHTTLDGFYLKIK